MRVLHLTPELPQAEGGGGGRANQYLLCRRLVELGSEVLNISPVLPDDAEHVADLRNAGVENWVVTRPRSPVVEVAEAIRADPAIVPSIAVSPLRVVEMRVFWTRLRELTARAVESWRPDVVIVCHQMAADWARAIPVRIPAVLMLHDVVWNHYLSRARLADPLTGARLRFEAARFRRHFRYALPRYTAMTTVSTLEASELRALTTLPVSELTIGTEVRELRCSDEPDGPPRVLFTGSLNYEPNRNGIIWFVEKVWPLIRRAVPDVRLDIVGRDPPPSVQRLGATDGVTVIGPVPTMAPYFAATNCVVAPIRTGAGVRVKIIEAMAARRAVVSTTLGCEGLPHLEPGRHLLIADEPTAFADAVASLLGDRARRQTIAAQARELAEAAYDWRSLGDELAALLRGIVDNASPRKL